MANTGFVQAGTITLNFDDVASLNEYAVSGVTFSANASIWSGFGGSVLTNPNGGPLSVPDALQFGNAGGVLGQIFFATDQSSISLWALSGPGSDLLNAPMYIEAYDASGALLDRDDVNASLQFDLLNVSGVGIRRLDVFSPIPANDVWDDLTLTSVPIPTTLLLLGVGLAGLGISRRKRSRGRS